MSLYSYIQLIFIFLIFIACGNKESASKVTSEDGSFEVKINISAGDEYYEIINQDTFSFTPYPYNLGSVKSNGDNQLSVLVLSNRLSRNSRIKILPIGILNYKEFNKDKKLIIGVPRDEKSRVISATDLIDLVTKYPSVKNIIQEWTLGKCGIGCSKFVSWEDGNAAGLWIQRNLS